MHSLSRRLIVSVAVPLVLFFGVTILVLDASFRDLSSHAMRDLLSAQMIALIAAAEPQPDGVVAPTGHSLETRLDTPGSGLYAQIRQANSDNGWRSPSATGVFIDFGVPLASGTTRYGQVLLPDGSRVAILSRGISFEEDIGKGTRALTFSVATSMTPYEEQLWSFRRRMFGWFLGLTLLLLATLGIVLRGVLAPVRRLEREINAVEEGERDSLGDGYPRELTGVTANLNALLAGERKRVARYRDTLGNLAHSLKTPLAVMRSTLSGDKAKGASSAQDSVLDGEIDRMTTIIEHQLKRAAAGGTLLGQAPVEIAPIAADLRSALLKVYANKDLSIEVVASADAQFVGDRGDLTEVLGNLLDNACKWCKSRVRISASTDSLRGPRQRLRIAVDDDGAGISDADRGKVFERGVRADEHVPGHGLGLAMVRDTVDLYGGALTISRSTLGGACITLHLPGR